MICVSKLGISYCLCRCFSTTRILFSFFLTIFFQGGAFTPQSFSPVCNWLVERRKRQQPLWAQGGQWWGKGKWDTGQGWPRRLPFRFKNLQASVLFVYTTVQCQWGETRCYFASQTPFSPQFWSQTRLAQISHKVNIEPNHCIRYSSLPTQSATRIMERIKLGNWLSTVHCRLRWWSSPRRSL